MGGLALVAARATCLRFSAGKDLSVSIRLFPFAFIAIVIFCSASSAGADEQAFTLTAEEVANPPERKLEFDETTTPAERTLPRPDPDLVAKKFAATLTVRVPPQSAYDPQLKDLNQLQDLGPGNLLFPHYGSNTRTVIDPLGEVLRRILAATPEEQRPPESEVEFLKAVPVDIVSSARDFSQVRDSFDREFILFAETAEEARSQAATLLEVLDHGLTRSYQVELFERRAAELAKLEQAQKALDAATAEYAELQKEAAEVADFPSDLLPSLRVQQLQLEVNLAGTKSRIEACQKLLEGKELQQEERRAKVLDLKTAAEVEFASFEAQQATIRRFVEKAKRSAELDTLLRANANVRVSQRRQVDRHKIDLRSLERKIMAYQPLPLVGKIRIQPLKWTHK